jgi:PIN domain nuclease of toxin-antitoxin system
VIVLADTHALIWWLTDPSRLSRIAHKQLRAAHDDAADGISISVASRIDLHYLAAKGKLPTEVVRAVWETVVAADTNLRPVPITPAVAERFGDPTIASTLPDPWDRFIVATALDLDAVLVTKDAAMQRLGREGLVRVIW